MAKRVIDLRNWKIKKTEHSEPETKVFKSIQEYSLHLIKTTSMDNDKIAEKVKDKFHSRTTPACISWYRNKLRKGEIK